MTASAFRPAGTFRKILAALLILMVFIGSAAFAENTEAAATVFSLQPYTDYPDLFQVTVDDENGIGFVSTKVSVASLAFTHAHESDTLYSFITSDIFVADPKADNPYPVLRTWIYYSADEPLNIHSVTFVYKDQRYTFTFSGEGDSVIETTENGIREKLNIRYGSQNATFLSPIMADALTDLVSQDENKASPEMKLILHGDEDIEVDVPQAFWQDFALLALPFTSNDYAWLSYIGGFEGTPCTVE